MISMSGVPIIEHCPLLFFQSAARPTTVSSSRGTTRRSSVSARHCDPRPDRTTTAAAKASLRTTALILSGAIEQGTKSLRSRRTQYRQVWVKFRLSRAGWDCGNHNGTTPDPKSPHHLHHEQRGVLSATTSVPSFSSIGEKPLPSAVHEWGQYLLYRNIRLCNLSWQHFSLRGNLVFFLRPYG